MREKVDIEFLPGSAGQDLTLGEFLRIIRRRAGLKQVELAQRSGVVNPRHVRAIENGEYDPRPDTLQALLDVLGYRLAIIVEPGQAYTYNDPALRALVRSTRQARSLSQLDLVHQAGVSEQAVVEFENPNGRPAQLSTVDRLLRFFGYTPRYVVEPKREDKNATLRGMRQTAGPAASGRVRRQ